MALISCPECGRENVSDTAKSCPSCGYGIKEHFDRIKKEEAEKQQQEIERKNGIYNNAVQKYLSSDPQIVKEGEVLFESILDWRDSETYYKKCQEKVQALLKEKERREARQKDATYNKAIEKMNSGNLIEVKNAVRLFISISGWKNADEYCKDCQEKIENEKKVYKQKRIKRICSFILLLLLIGSVATVMIVYPDTDSYKYKKAMSAYNGGEYEEALDIWREILDYKNSSDLYSECQYELALVAYDSKDYEKASYFYADIKNYKDSNELYKDCQYQLAVTAYDSQDYDTAIELFSTIKDYEDSKMYLKDAKYIKASQLFVEKKYDESMSLAKSIGNHDAIKLIKCNKYEIGKIYLEKSKYLEAFEYLNGLTEDDLKFNPNYDGCYFDTYNECVEIITNSENGSYAYGKVEEIVRLLKEIQGMNKSLDGESSIEIDQMKVTVQGNNTVIPKGTYDTMVVAICDDYLYLENMYCELQFEDVDARLILPHSSGDFLGMDLINDSTDNMKTYYSDEGLDDLRQREQDEKEANERWNQMLQENQKEEPRIGMTAMEVEKSTWGEPEDINKTTYRWGTTEQWCYSGYRYIYFENGVVTAISE